MRALCGQGRDIKSEAVGKGAGRECGIGVEFVGAGVM